MPSARSAAAAIAPSAAAAVCVPVGHVFVKRSGEAGARFAKVDIFAGDEVADLAENASKARGWRVGAAYIGLCPVLREHVLSVQRGE